VSVGRLRAAHWAAFVAALALLFVTAMDWYSTTGGDEARRIEELSDPEGAAGGEIEREVQEDARVAAEGAEKNAWQADGAIDRVILVGLLLTAALAVLAAFAARESRGAVAPIAMAGIAASVTALLVTYRIFQEPGFDAGTTIKAGAPLALVVLGVIALASAVALRTES
jgi:VIT1/CCC1 family predicted Fe2+/Mn2+ transporter